jgi:hypothetical protein
MAIYLSLCLLKGVQAKEEAFSPQQRTSSTSKNEIHELFSTFVGQLCPPGSGSRDRTYSESIRIHNIAWSKMPLNILAGSNLKLRDFLN